MAPLTVAEIIDQVDILTYISQFCQLEERNGEYWGLSPLKKEQTPSFSVNPILQRFYDFSSGQGGNVLDFIRSYYRCGFREGLDILKAYAQIQEEAGQESPLARLAASTVAKRYQNHPKPQKQPKYTILPPDYMQRYTADPAKLAPWRQEGISQAALEEFQVRYDAFSNRIVFPIRNLNGDIINVCGRTLDPSYREKKIPKYIYFKPLGILNTLYGFAEHKKEILAQKEIILFEGAKSVLLAHSWGIKNTAALLTSHLNPHQFQILIRLGVTITFALDAEVDIQKDHQIQKLLPYATVYWLKNQKGVLSPKDSPVDLGKEVFQTLYAERRRL